VQTQTQPWYAAAGPACNGHGCSQGVHQCHRDSCALQDRIMQNIQGLIQHQADRWGMTASASCKDRRSTHSRQALACQRHWLSVHMPQQHSMSRQQPASQTLCVSASAACCHPTLLQNLPASTPWMHALYPCLLNRPGGATAGIPLPQVDQELLPLQSEVGQQPACLPACAHLGVCAICFDQRMRTAMLAAVPPVQRACLPLHSA
jgi:hypothetical protein